MSRLSTLGLSLALAAAAGGCAKENLPEFTLVLEGHKFTPNELSVPANQKFRVKVDNRDDASEEFDSESLGREKVVPAKSVGTVIVGPLKAGRYPFMGEFHAETAQGVIVAQ